MRGGGGGIGLDVPTVTSENLRGFVTRFLAGHLAPWQGSALPSADGRDPAFEASHLLVAANFEVITTDPFRDVLVWGGGGGG